MLTTTKNIRSCIISKWEELLKCSKCNNMVDSLDDLFEGKVCRSCNINNNNDRDNDATNNNKKNNNIHHPLSTKISASSSITRILSILKLLKEEEEKAKIEEEEIDESSDEQQQQHISQAESSSSSFFNQDDNNNNNNKGDGPNNGNDDYRRQQKKRRRLLSSSTNDADSHQGSSDNNNNISNNNNNSDFVFEASSSSPLLPSEYRPTTTTTTTKATIMVDPDPDADPDATTTKSDESILKPRQEFPQQDGTVEVNNNHSTTTPTISSHVVLSTRQQKQPTFLIEKSTTTNAFCSSSSEEEEISKKQIQQHCREEIHQCTEEELAVGEGNNISIQQQRYHANNKFDNNFTHGDSSNDRWKKQGGVEGDDDSAKQKSSPLVDRRSINDDANNDSTKVDDELQTITTNSREPGGEKRTVTNVNPSSEQQQHDEQGASMTFEEGPTASPPYVESLPTVALPQTMDFCYPNDNYEQNRSHQPKGQRHPVRSSDVDESRGNNIVNTTRNNTTATSSYNSFYNDKQRKVNGGLTTTVENRMKKNFQREMSQKNDPAYYHASADGYEIGSESIECSIDTNALPETMDFCVDSRIYNEELRPHEGSDKDRIRDADPDNKSIMAKRLNIAISNTNSNQILLQDTQSREGIPVSNSSLYPSTHIRGAESSCQVQQGGLFAAKSKYDDVPSTMHREERSQKETQHSMSPFDELSPLTQTCELNNQQTQTGSFQSRLGTSGSIAVTPVIRGKSYSDIDGNVEEQKSQDIKGASNHVNAHLDKPLVTPWIEPPLGRNYGYPRTQGQYRSGRRPNGKQHSFDHETTNTVINTTLTSRGGGQQEKHSQQPIHIIIDVLAPSEHAALQSLDRTKFRTIFDFGSALNSASMVLAVHVKNRPDPFRKNNRKVLAPRLDKKVCFRTFKYLRARAAGFPIVSIGELGTPVWGDFTLYHQIVIGDPEYGWLKDAPWWDSHDSSPVSTGPRGQQQNKKLLSEFKVLVLDADVPIRVPTRNSHILAATDKLQLMADREDRLASDCNYFEGISQTEAELLSELVGATVLRSISNIGKTDHLVLVNDTVDEESIEEIFPRLVNIGIIPCDSNLNLDCTSGSYKSSRIKFVYYSWLVDSISAGLVAPLELYSLGFLEPMRKS